MRWGAALVCMAATVGCDRLLSLDPVTTPVPPGDSMSGERLAQLGWVTGEAVANDTHDTTVSLTLPAAPAVGDTMIVAISSFECAVAAVADSAGNGYVKTPASPLNSPMAALAIWVAPVTATSGVVTVTVTGSATGTSPELSVSADVYAGLIPTIPPVDEDGHTTSPDATLLACGSVMTGAGPHLVFAAMTHDRDGAATVSSDFTRRHEPTTMTANTTTLVVADRIVDQPQTVMPTFTVSNASSAACDTIVLR